MRTILVGFLIISSYVPVETTMTWEGYPTVYTSEVIVQPVPIETTMEWEGEPKTFRTETTLQEVS